MLKFSNLILIIIILTHLDVLEARKITLKSEGSSKDTNSNSLVIIENQLEKTNHDHLGKTITYASGLDAEVIIWIAKEFKEEHRKAIDYLNEKASPELRCFAVEIQLFISVTVII